jgi:hypothetical protein
LKTRLLRFLQQKRSLKLQAREIRQSSTQSAKTLQDPKDIENSRDGLNIQLIAGSYLKSDQKIFTIW